MAKKKGLVHIYCGQGKGKTTAACGLALRAAGWGKRVYLFFFFKSACRQGEIISFAKLKNLKIFCFDRKHPFFVKEKKNSYKKKLKAELGEFLKQVKIVLKKRDNSVVILDEVLTAIGEDLMAKKELIDLLKTKAPDIEVVLTGRPRPPRSILMLADYVSEVKNLKHPYKKGIAARKGIDF